MTAPATFDLCITEDGSGRATLSLGPAVIDLTNWAQRVPGVWRATASPGQGDVWRWVVLSLLEGWTPHGAAP